MSKLQQSRETPFGWPLRGLCQLDRCTVSGFAAIYRPQKPRRNPFASQARWCFANNLLLVDRGFLLSCIHTALENQTSSQPTWNHFGTCSTKANPRVNIQQALYHSSKGFVIQPFSPVSCTLSRVPEWGSNNNVYEVSSKQSAQECGTEKQMIFGNVIEVLKKGILLFWWRILGDV